MQAGATGCFFFQAEDGIRDADVTGVQTCALPIWAAEAEGQRIHAGGSAFSDDREPRPGSLQTALVLGAKGHRAEVCGLRAAFKAGGSTSRRHPGPQSPTRGNAGIEVNLTRRRS